MKYEEILFFPHYELKNHPKMSMQNRAAQFAPFAALTGYEEVVYETGRITHQKLELDEEQKIMIDRKLQTLERNQKIMVSYFEKDKRKNGGAYKKYCGIFKKIDTIQRVLIFLEGKQIPLDDIYDMEGKNV